MWNFVLSPWGTLTYPESPHRKLGVHICLGGGKGTRVNHFCPQFHQMAGLTGLVVIVSWERVTCWEGLAIILSWKWEEQIRVACWEKWRSPKDWNDRGGSYRFSIR